MAYKANIFPSEYYGWIASRLFVYFLFPIAISTTLYKLLEIKFIKSLIISLTISSATIFVISDSNDQMINMFGLELSSYGLSSIIFLFLLAIYPKVNITNSNKYYFFILLFVCITTFEAFIVICGVFIISRLLVQTYDFKSFCLFIIEDKITKVLIGTLILGLLTIVFSPSYFNRQVLIESSTNTLDGLVYILLNLEETIFLLYKTKITILILIILGFCIAIINKKPLPKNTIYFLLPLFFSPFIYSLIVNFLLSTNTEYWMKPIRSDEFMFFGNYLAEDNKYNKGAMGLRQNFFLMLSIYLNIFILSFLFFNNELYSYFTILIISGTLFIFHPDGIGTLKIVDTLINKDEMKIENLPEINNFSSYQSIYNKLSENNQKDLFFYPRRDTSNYQSVIASILIENKMQKSTNKEFNPLQFDKIFMSNRVPFFAAWREKIYNKYQLIFKNDNFLNFSNKTNNSILTTKNYFFNNYNKSFFDNKKIDTPNELGWTTIKNIKITAKKSRCLFLKNINGTPHFAKANIFIKKGLNYIVFEYLPNKSNIIIEIKSNKSFIKFPLSSNEFIENNNLLVPVMRQNITKNKISKLKFIYLSKHDQKASVFWKNENDSYICPSYNGFIVNN